MISVEEVKLLREVEAIKIPSGILEKLSSGEQVKVLQDKGSSATLNYKGNLYLLTSVNLDAIGKESKQLEKLKSGAKDEEIINFAWQALSQCYDPEIPVNIVSLGLVYDLKLINLIDGKRQLYVKMTLTSPTCGIGDVIAKDAQTRLEQIEDVDKVLVEIVLTPAWSREMMSDEAKLELGLF